MKVNKNNEPEIIGFIGLGTMGKPMALNLIKAGYSLLIYDIDVESINDLVSKGARASSSVAEIGRQCNVVITMLPEARHVQEVVLAKGGLIDHLSKGTLFIDMSSIAPQTSKLIAEKLSEKGCYVLDAPVSGGPAGAESGTLSIMVGGNQQAWEKGLPILEVLGKKIVYMGEAGSGQLTKLCNQILIAVNLQAVIEAFALAAKSGLNLLKVREVLSGGAAGSKVLEMHGLKIIERTFDQPAFKLKLHRKDLAAAIETANHIGVPLAATELVISKMDEAIALGYAEMDHTSTMLIEELLANINTKK